MAKRITQLSELTTAAQDDYIVIVDTSTGTTKKITVKNLTGLPDFGWVATGESWSYSSYSSATKLAVITVPTDATVKYSVGMFVRFSQSTGGTKYGELQAVTSTSLTVYMSTYTLNNEAISSPVYSSERQPFGLPESAFAWQPWTPTWTNLTIGNGVFVGAYRKEGKRVYIRFSLTWGSTTSATASRTIFTLPVTANSALTGAAGTFEGFYFGNVRLLDASSAAYAAVLEIEINDATKANVTALGAGGSHVAQSSVNNTTPFTWGTGDVIQAIGMYEAA